MHVRVCVCVYLSGCMCVCERDSHSHSPRSSSHFPFSSIHHCYCHSPTKGCSQQDTSNEAPKDSTYTHTGAVTSYVRKGREVGTSKDEHANTRLILYITHQVTPYSCHPNHYICFVLRILIKHINCYLQCYSSIDTVCCICHQIHSR